MYKAPDRSIKNPDYYINKEKAYRINKWLTALDTKNYNVDTAEEEGYYGTIRSILHKNGDWVIFDRLTPVLHIRKLPNAITETQFLLNGSDIDNQPLANAMTIGLSSYRVGIRKLEEGYCLNVSAQGAHTGNYSGQKITIRKGQTLVWEKVLYGDDKRPEAIYIKELQGTETAPPKEVCPDRQGQLHEYVCWFSHKETAYQSCRYCYNLWSKSPRSPVYRLLEHAPWHIANEVKKGLMHERWFLSLPGTDIWWNPENKQWAWPQWNNYLQKTTIHLLPNYNSDSIIPSYPATQEQIERNEKLAADATN